MAAVLKDSLLKAIKTLFNSDQSAGTVYAAVGGRYDCPRAPDKQTWPYIVGNVIDGVSDPVLNNTSVDEYRFQFSIFSDKKTDASECVEILDKLRALFDDATLSFAGTSNDHASWFVERDIDTGPDVDDSERMMCTQDYLIRVQRL